MSLSSSVSSQTLNKLLEHFPQRFAFAFAYGSGVISQGTDVSTVNSTSVRNDLFKSHHNMIDFIFTVDDPISWHSENIIKNASHYSIIKKFGPKVISSVQQSFGAKIYFNTLIPLNGHLIKYGVISTKHLINDLLDWDTLYVSGRLHKPVHVLIEPKNDELQKALKINYQSAIHAALLTLPEVFTAEELYLTIAGLSYSGDFRMIIGEDKNKVKKIVSPQLNRFRSIYHPFLSSQSMSNVLQWNPESGNYIQDCSSRITLHHLNLLPKNIQQHLCVARNVNGRLRDLDDVLLSLSRSYDCQTYVNRAINEIVWYSSWGQTFKGVFTAGLFKSLRYGSKKLFKMFKGFHILQK